ncbi:MAG: NTP transferase domain-containing protein [Taibaiella sp.]|nr:NTP transferase domain-containing protein [Taibaiella sp.]
MNAMLFAAGSGTRLKPFTDNHPKALATVNGKTLLEHNLCFLQRYGIYDVVINVHHFAIQIMEAITYNKGFGSNITISDESDEVLETGGGLKKAAHNFHNEHAFVVMNVDVLCNIQLDKMIAAHQASDAIATLAVMQRNSSRQLLFDEHMMLCGWANNTTGQQRIAREVLSMKPYAFSGIQVLTPAVLDIPFNGKFSIIDVYLHHAREHIIKGYDHTGDVFIDVGKPESLEKAAHLFAK